MNRTHTAAVLFAAFILTGCTSASPSRDVRLSFREGSGRTIVMLGGGVYGAAMFAPHARELSNEFDVIRVETLNVQTAGSGAAMPPDYSPASEAAALRSTLDALGVKGPVDLVGVSYGAVVALHFAVSHPQRVRTVTLFEPPAFWTLSDEEKSSDRVLSELLSLTGTMTPSSAPSDQQLFRFRCLLGGCPPSIPGITDPSRAEWDRSRQAMRGLAGVQAHREDPRRLARLNRPVLLLNGTETVAFHRLMNERLARILARTETAQLPGSHTAPRTAATEFVRLLRDFLHRNL